jgi:hypothetical protein
MKWINLFFYYRRIYRRKKNYQRKIHRRSISVGDFIGKLITDGICVLHRWKNSIGKTIKSCSEKKKKWTRGGVGLNSFKFADEILSAIQEGIVRLNLFKFVDEILSVISRELLTCQIANESLHGFFYLFFIPLLFT